MKTITLRLIRLVAMPILFLLGILFLFGSNQFIGIIFLISGFVVEILLRLKINKAVIQQDEKYRIEQRQKQEKKDSN